MGSLKDYGRRRREQDPFAPPRERQFLRRLLKQSMLSVAFFFLIAALISADNGLGEGARYIAASGVAADNSWIDWQGSNTDPDTQALPVSGEADGADNADNADKTDKTDNAGDATGDNTGDEAADAANTTGDDTLPLFTAPASGIVVTDLAVAVSGFSTQLGVTISGTAGQQVKATAAGTVAYLGSSEDGYIVEIVHDSGFSSVYQGLSELSVGSGEEVAAAQLIGETASGDITFSLLHDGQEVDPLEYLFRSEE